MSCFLHTLDWTLNFIGVLALQLLVLSLFSTRLSYWLEVPLTPRSLRLLRRLSLHPVKFLLFTTITYLACTQLNLLFPGLLTLESKPLVAAVSGLLLAIALFTQGLPLPVGPGLRLTMERAPKLGMKLSKSVLSFHIDSRFVKEPHGVKKLIAKVMNDAAAAGSEEDFVLKSWLFARKGGSEKAVSAIRRLMTLQRYFLLGAFVFIVALSIAVNFDTRIFVLLNGSYWPFILAGVVALGAVFGSLWKIHRLAKKRTEEASEQMVETRSAMKLGEDLERLSGGYVAKLIAWRPIPLGHVFLMGLASPEITKLCAGTESGVVMRRYKGPKRTPGGQAHHTTATEAVC